MIEKIDMAMELINKNGFHSGIIPQEDSNNFHLYDEKDLSTEAISYRNFLKSHSIKFLGGGNSKNFKVENMDATHGY